MHCHMPARVTEIPHTSVSDHRFPRRPESFKHAAAKRKSAYPLMHFHRELLGDDPEHDRDLGIALMEQAGLKSPIAPQELAGLALPLLERAHQRHPDDLRAWSAKANALWLQGRSLEAQRPVQLERLSQNARMIRR